MAGRTCLFMLLLGAMQCVAIPFASFATDDADTKPSVAPSVEPAPGGGEMLRADPRFGHIIHATVEPGGKVRVGCDKPEPATGDAKAGLAIGSWHRAP